MGYKILEIGTYVGSTQTDSEFFVEHFKKQGKDIKHFMDDVMGRTSVCTSKDKNTLEMAYEAVDEALDKNHLKGEEIDMIIFVSSFPEYTVPPNAIAIHQHINGSQGAICFDLNGNCTGMWDAIEMARCKIELSQAYKRALIVGSECFSLSTSEDDEIFYGQFADTACAVIIEKTNDSSGTVAFSGYVDNTELDTAFLPDKGFSNLLKQDDLTKEDLWVKYYHDRAHFSASQVGVDQITSLLKESNISIEDIKVACLAQNNINTIKFVANAIGIDIEKCPFPGKHIGYTGASCNLFALKEAVDKKMVQRGDLVLFWAIGMGVSSVCSIIRY